MAATGLARVLMRDGDLAGARLLLQKQLAKTATPDLANAVGELSDALGDATAANSYDQMAEQIERGAWGNGLRQPQVMARLLAERPGRTTEAVSLAEEAARGRADIMTMDALAWAYYKNGQWPDAQRAVTQALRTGTRNARILCHAEQIGLRLKPEATSTGAPGATRRCLEWHP
jgi:Tfp pilus assembly protein PilF